MKYASIALVAPILLLACTVGPTIEPKGSSDPFADVCPPTNYPATKDKLEGQRCIEKLDKEQYRRDRECARRANRARREAALKPFMASRGLTTISRPRIEIDDPNSPLPRIDVNGILTRDAQGQVFVIKVDERVTRRVYPLCGCSNCCGAEMMGRPASSAYGSTLQLEPGESFAGTLDVSYRALELDTKHVRRACVPMP